MKIIDSHVHFPANAAPDAWRNMLDAAHRAGISQLVVSHVFCGGAYPAQTELHNGNLFCYEASRRSGGEITALVYLNPQLPDWEKELDEGRQAGAKGAKLWISLKDGQGSLANTVKVLRACAGRNFPVLIHVFERSGGNLPGEINMQELRRLAETVPDCTVIAAHSGANVDAALPEIRRCPSNVFFDICGFAPANGMLGKILSAVSPERVLYGSDGMGRSFASQLLKVFSEALAPADMEKILWRNVQTIYRLPEPVDRECPLCELHAPRRDFFIFAGRWPYLPRPVNTPEELESLLEKEDVCEAWVPSLDAALAENALEKNLEFGGSCQTCRRIRPLAAVDPVAPEALTKCRRLYESGLFAGFWLSPYLHGYTPDCPEVHPVLEWCAEQKIPVFLNLEIDDYRFRADGVKFRAVSPEEVAGFFAQAPVNTYVVQGKGYMGSKCPKGSRIFWVSNRNADSLNDVRNFPQLAPGIAWVQGSEYPFRPLKSALAQLPTDAMEPIC